MKEEILNIEYYYKTFSIKALNRSKTIKDAANLLGITERTLHRYKKEFNIQFCKEKNEYVLKP